MKKIFNYFELTLPYHFEVGDLTALIYVLCAVLVMCGINATIPFFIGATIATAFCWQARRVNLVVLNVALWVMNAYNLIIMIWGEWSKNIILPLFSLFGILLLLTLIALYFFLKGRERK